VAQYYTIEVEKDPNSNLAAKLHFERTNVAAKEYAGVYCLRTNIMDWGCREAFAHLHHVD
jgi:hypothetical protein